MQDHQPPADAAALRARYRVAAIIGGALFLSVLVHALVVEFLLQGGMTPETAPLAPAQAEALKLALLGVSAAVFFVIRAVNAFLLRPAAGPRQAGPVQRLFTAAVVTCALCEAPVMFGFVLFVLGRDRADFYLFFLIACFFFSFHFPRFRQWEEAVRQPRH